VRPDQKLIYVRATSPARFLWRNSGAIFSHTQRIDCLFSRHVSHTALILLQDGAPPRYHASLQ
jgi:hypothetical protein